MSELKRFIHTIATLRGPNGCPWDKKQTHQTLKPYLIEECYELIDAINSKKSEHICEELGDVLLQVMLHAQIAKDAKKFDIEDIAKSINTKMIRRHPHVFAKTKVKTAKEVTTNWDIIKQSEGKRPKLLLDTIPKAFPALLEASHLGRKAAKVGFEWKQPLDVVKTLKSEVRELEAALKQKNQSHIEDEFGDVLFSLANLARRFGVDPELALKRGNKKFRKRFGHMEQSAKKQKKELKKLGFSDWQELWQKAKRG